MHWIQWFKPITSNYRTCSPCIPRHPRERVAVSHCSSLHTKDLPETAPPTSSQPESLPYAAKISFFIPYCTADQHPRPLLHTATHAYESPDKVAGKSWPPTHQIPLPSPQLPLSCSIPPICLKWWPTAGFHVQPWHVDTSKAPSGGKQNGARFVCLQPTAGAWGHWACQRLGCFRKPSLTCWDRRERQAWATVEMEMVPSPAPLIKRAHKEQQVGLNDPTTSSAFVTLLPPSQQGSCESVWSNQNINRTFQLFLAV